MIRSCLKTNGTNKWTQATERRVEWKASRCIVSLGGWQSRFTTTEALKPSPSWFTFCTEVIWYKIPGPYVIGAVPWRYTHATSKEKAKLGSKHPLGSFPSLIKEISQKSWSTSETFVISGLHGNHQVSNRKRMGNRAIQCAFRALNFLRVMK